MSAELLVKTVRSRVDVWVQAKEAAELKAGETEIVKASE